MQSTAKRKTRILRHPLFLCLVSFFACLLLGLVLFFPLTPFARQLEQMAATQQLEMEIERPHLLFPFGLGAKQIKLAHPQLPHPPFQLNDLSLRPLWLSLFGKNPGLSFELNILQGTLAGSAYRDGTTRAVLENLQLEEKLGPQLPLTLKGLVSDASFEGSLPIDRKNQSKLLLNARDLRLEGVKRFGIADDKFQVGQLQLAADINGQVLQLQSLASTGPNFDLKGNGSIRIGTTPARSSLNLNLVLTPKADLDPMLRDLLSLLKKPQPDGNYTLHLTGPLSNPRLN